MASKRANWKTYLIFGVALMFVNWWISDKMLDEPFQAFIVVVILVNAILGFGFKTIYNTIMRDDSKKNGK